MYRTTAMPKSATCLIVLAGTLYVSGLATETSAEFSSCQQHRQQSSNGSTCALNSPTLKCSDQSARGGTSSLAIWRLADHKQQSDASGRAVNWNYDYVEQRYSPKFRDDSADQRLANIIRTGNMAKPFYHFLFKFDSPIEGLDDEQLERLAAGSRVNDTLCSQHLSELLGQLDEIKQITIERRKQNTGAKFQEKHLRLADLLDSFGGYESGLMVGRTLSHGSYTQCKDTQLLLNNELVRGRYCMANLDITKHQDVGLRLAKERLYDIEKAEDVISVAICLPESCHSRNFAQNRELFQRLVDSRFELPGAIYQEQHLKLDSVFCELDQDSALVQVPFSGKLLILFLTAWVAAALYSTFCYDSVSIGGGGSSSSSKDSSKDITSASIGDRFMQCLNLRSSFEDFICANDRNFEGTTHRVSLSTLNPVKVGTCLFVIVGHSMMAHGGLATDVIGALREMQSSSLIYFLQGGTVSVDTFYVITGILIAFVAMKRLNASPIYLLVDPSGEKKRNEIIDEEEEKERDKTIAKRSKKIALQCLSFILMRFVRLVPLYFLVFWFKKSLMPTLGSGPFWDYGYNKETEAGSCRAESWLTPFTFQAAYLPLGKQCMPQAWSVAGDLFFSLIVGPILVLIAVKPVLAASLALAICFVSNLSMLNAYFNIDPDLLNDAMDFRLISVSRLFKVNSLIYTAPHFRVFSILIGVLAGYLLYHYSKATDDSHKLRHWPGWFRGFATKAALVYIVLALLTGPMIPKLKASLFGRMALHRNLVLHMLTTNRLLWALSNAIVFLRMVTDWKDTYLMRNGAGKFWASMAKLNFAILLVHVDFIKFDNYVQLNSMYYSPYNIARQLAFAYLFSLIAATILYVTIENPLDKFLKKTIQKK